MNDSNAFFTWLAMGRYAAYVWPSFLLTLIVVWLNVYWARNSFHAARVLARQRLAARSGPMHADAGSGVEMGLGSRS